MSSCIEFFQKKNLWTFSSARVWQLSAAAIAASFLPTTKSSCIVAMTLVAGIMCSTCKPRSETAGTIENLALAMITGGKSNCTPGQCLDKLLRNEFELPTTIDFLSQIWGTLFENQNVHGPVAGVNYHSNSKHGLAPTPPCLGIISPIDDDPTCYIGPQFAHLKSEDAADEPSACQVMSHIELERVPSEVSYIIDAEARPSCIDEIMDLVVSCDRAYEGLVSFGDRNFTLEHWRWSCALTFPFYSSVHSLGDFCEECFDRGYEVTFLRKDSGYVENLEQSSGDDIIDFFSAWTKFLIDHNHLTIYHVQIQPKLPPQKKRPTTAAEPKPPFTDTASPVPPEPSSTIDDGDDGDGSASSDTSFDVVDPKTDQDKKLS